MVLKKPNFIYTFEEGTPTKEESDKTLLDLMRVLCKLTIEEEINKSKFKSKKEEMYTQYLLEEFADGTLKNIEKSLKNKKK